MVGGEYLCYSRLLTNLTLIELSRNCVHLTTFHNVSTVASTDQVYLHVNCLSEAPLSTGNTV